MVPPQVQNAEVTDSSVIPGDKNNCPLTVFSKISITSSPVSSFNSLVNDVKGFSPLSISPAGISYM